MQNSHYTLSHLHLLITNPPVQVASATTEGGTKVMKVLDLVNPGCSMPHIPTLDCYFDLKTIHSCNHFKIVTLLVLYMV